MSAPSWIRFARSHRLAIALAVAALLALALVATAFQLAVRSLAASEGVAQAQRVIRTLDEILLGVQAEMVTQRGVTSLRASVRALRSCVRRWWA